MNTRLTVLVAVVVGFGALTAVALMDVGYFGLFEAQLKSWSGMQVLIDLILMGLLVCIWMVVDARKNHWNPWPFVLITLGAGSFGPLLYLIVREVRVRPKSV